MARPRFRPVESVRNPRHFGRVEHPEWSDDAQMTQVERLWAVTQHRASYVVHVALAESGRTIADLAREVGESESWARRKLTGQVPADVGDLLGWSIVCGVDVWPVLDSVAE
jgi:hypothetical protein